MKPQLGVAGFFIDMAVRNPDRRGEFLAGIECDGATYHSGFSVRDRDRIRQEILESLGWKDRIYRIWSTDWFYDPKRQIEGNMSSSNGTTGNAHTRRNTMRAATWKGCRIYWTGKGVVWFTVISSASGQQGYVTAADENDYVKRMGASPTAVLLDPSGDLGHLYGAKTTPVISPQGQLIYDGAIDNKPTTEQSDIAGATNYVTAALEGSMAGKPVAVTASQPYGCSVKYAH